MNIGTVKEIKINENRVGIIPGFVASLVRQGHHVFIEKNAGVGSGFTDEDYRKAGATVLPTADEVWQKADMIVKVKEPLEAEYGKIRPNQILFTYLHLAPDVPQRLREALIKGELFSLHARLPP